MEDRIFAFEYSWPLQELLAPIFASILERNWNKEEFEKKVLKRDSHERQSFFQKFLKRIYCDKKLDYTTWKTRRIASLAYILERICQFNIAMVEIRLRVCKKLLLIETPDESIFSWTKEGYQISRSPCFLTWLFWILSSCNRWARREVKPRSPYRLTDPGLESLFPNFFLDVQNGAD